MAKTNNPLTQKENSKFVSQDASTSGDYTDEIKAIQLLTNRIHELEKENDNRKKELNGIKPIIKKLEIKTVEAVDDLGNKTIKTQDTFIQTLGIFTALFTFISVEFRFLNQRMCYPQIISLTILLAGILMLFIFLLGYITNKNNTITTVLVILSIFVIILDVMFYPTWENNNVNCKILESISEEVQKTQTQPFVINYILPNKK